MLALIKKELSSYFSSPIGYIFSAVFLVLAGLYFFVNVILLSQASMAPVIQSIFSISFVLVPLLTMRLISEEKRQKTDQALITAPMNIFEIVMGKFLGAFTMYAVASSIVFVYAAVISLYATPSWGIIIGGYIGILGAGAFLISLGMFISSLTENQFIAAVASYGVTILIMLVDSVLAQSTNTIAIFFQNYFSINKHFAGFTTGLFSIADVIFYLSFAFLFIFLTIRTIDKKRWS